MVQRKGIILAGGTGSRLFPLTIAVSKQLMPVYDKPMIFYPLSILMLAGIREIMIISSSRDLPQFKNLLGNGEQWGLRLCYAVQDAPNGLAEAYLIAEDFLDGGPSALILGDNIFHGFGLGEILRKACADEQGGTIFGYHVTDPCRYGVADISTDGELIAIEEKPSNPPSPFAVTGLYFLDKKASSRAKLIHPSARGELEIVDLLNMYIDQRNLVFERLGRGHVWLDTGTHDSLIDAANYVRTIQNSQGLLVGSPDEISYNLGWIDADQFFANISIFLHTSYGQTLAKLIKG